MNFDGTFRKCLVYSQVPCSPKLWYQRLILGSPNSKAEVMLRGMCCLPPINPPNRWRNAWSLNLRNSFMTSKSRTSLINYLSSLTRTSASLRKRLNLDPSRISIIFAFMSTDHSFPDSGFLQEGHGLFRSRCSRPTLIPGYSSYRKFSQHDISWVIFN